MPNEGAASERTEAWISYDDNFFYLSCRCWDSAPPEEWTANEMRRDTSQLRQNDMFGALLDTFHDRRNGFNFYTNPLGALADQAITNEGNPNADWNPVWFVRTGRFEGGWTVEMAIPFRSIRYVSGADQEWGIQLRRSIRRKNEWTHLTFVPAADRRRHGHLPGVGGRDDGRPGSAAGEQEHRAQAVRHLEARRPTWCARQPVTQRLHADAGGDAKYGINANLTADLTINTDFAQVEVDEQQVNLTRFNLEFPEKRDFFLEGRGMFEFGRGSGQGGRQQQRRPRPSSSTPPHRAQPQPRRAHQRRRAAHGQGRQVQRRALNIQTAEEPLALSPSTNFTVMRVKRDVLRRSSVGAMFTNRSAATVGEGSNQGYGVDGAFSFFENLNLSGYYAATETPRRSRATRRATRGGSTGRRIGTALASSTLKVGDDFNPEVGFVRRDDFNSTFGLLRFSPRPESIEAVRKFTWEASLEYLENGLGQLETRAQAGRFNTEFESSDQFTLDVSNNYELLVAPFPIAPDVIIPPGGYDFVDATVSYLFGQQRRISGTVAVQGGGFYDGDITAVTVSSARISATPQLSIEPSVSINDIDLPYGDFTNTLLRARTDFAFSPRMFASGLFAVQLHREQRQQQPALPVGIPSRQRALRRLHRRTRHGGAGLSGVEEPCVRGQDHPAVADSDVASPALSCLPGSR